MSISVTSFRSHIWLGLLSFLFCILIFGGCKSRAVIPYPSHGSGEVSFEESIRHAHSKERKQIIEVSHQWLGTPYHYAHAEKGVGTDCSGMVLGVYLEATELKLPRNSAKQAEFCKEIRREDIKPGDLVFFATGRDPSKVSHVGIMLDDENFIHASSSKGVCISKITTPYFSRTFLLFGRVPGIK